MKTDYAQLALSLALESRSSGQIFRLRVSSGSMRPWLDPGDVVVVTPALASELKPGDIIVVQSAAGLLTHRLISSSSEWLITKGDACWMVDPPVPPSALFGRVAASERGGRRIWNFLHPVWRVLQPGVGLFNRVVLAMSVLARRLRV